MLVLANLLTVVQSSKRLSFPECKRATLSCPGTYVLCEQTQEGLDSTFIWQRKLLSQSEILQLQEKNSKPSKEL